MSEQRTEDAARLLGYAEPAIRPTSERSRIRKLVERTGERIGAVLDKEKLDALVLEGATLGRDEFCELALRRGESARTVSN